MTHTALGGKFYSEFLKVQLLFNIFICGMFFFREDYEIANYADEYTPYSGKTNHKLVTEEL